jgi:hypothetical protein
MATVGDTEAALLAGVLMPSVTNIIDTLNKPFLNTWYASEAGKAAVAVTKSHPGLIASKPWDAQKWIAGAAPRKAQAAASLGDEVHNAVEALARGEHFEVSAAAQPYIDSWHAFVADFSPEFLHLEATCYGTVNSDRGPLRYAGTADFIACINGVNVVGDYKSGKSIHTEAALQLSALAHATLITNDDHSGLEDMPLISGGVVLHLTPTGYVLYPTDVDGGAWDTFSTLRALWNFQQKNLASRAPLFTGAKVTSVEGLVFPPRPGREPVEWLDEPVPVPRPSEELVAEDPTPTVKAPAKAKAATKKATSKAATKKSE